MDRQHKDKPSQHPGGTGKRALPGFGLDIVIASLYSLIPIFIQLSQIFFVTLKRNHIAGLAAVSLVVAGIFLFALFIHKPWPWKIIALSALLASALIIGFTPREVSLLSILGIGKPSLRIYLLMMVGLIIGTALGIYTRHHFELGLLPVTLTLVAVIAPLTGAMEELLFRGYIQGKLNSINPIFAVLYAAISHTAYKLLVIYSLGRPLEFDFLFLAQWTFLGGLAFGSLRFFAQSIFPPLIAHAIFDIILYGGLLTAPFWVWS